MAVAGKLAEEGDPHKLMLNRLSHEVAFRCVWLRGGRQAGRLAAGGVAGRQGWVCGGRCVDWQMGRQAVAGVLQTIGWWAVLADSTGAVHWGRTAACYGPSNEK